MNEYYSNFSAKICKKLEYTVFLYKKSCKFMHKKLKNRQLFQKMLAKVVLFSHFLLYLPLIHIKTIKIRYYVRK